MCGSYEAPTKYVAPISPITDDAKAFATSPLVGSHLVDQTRVQLDFAKVPADKLESLIEALYTQSFGTDRDDIAQMIANRSTKLLLLADDGEIGDLLEELVKLGIGGASLEIVTIPKPEYYEVGGSGDLTYLTFSVDIGVAGNPVYDYLAQSFVVPPAGTTKIAIGQTSLITMIGTLAVNLGYNILGIIEAQTTDQPVVGQVFATDLTF